MNSISQMIFYNRQNKREANRMQIQRSRLIWLQNGVFFHLTLDEFRLPLLQYALSRPSPVDKFQSPNQEPLTAS